MIHAHGTPITPRSELMKLAGRNFCVSYAAPEQVEVCHRIGQSVLLDNGAFTFWRKGIVTDDAWWEGYYAWCERWLAYWTTWAVIPDVIDGSVEENDRLLDAWPFGKRGAPVWHLHEPLERLVELAERFSRVCMGSSGQYAQLGSVAWHRRMGEAFKVLCVDGVPSVPVHMLRGMAYSNGPYPFASVDSSDIARNHHRPRNSAAEMALRWDSMQPPARWVFHEQGELGWAA